MAEAVRPQPKLLISNERFTFFKPKNILKDLTLVIGAEFEVEGLSWEIITVSEKAEYYT